MIGLQATREKASIIGVAKVTTTVAEILVVGIPVGTTMVAEILVVGIPVGIFSFGNTLVYETSEGTAMRTKLLPIFLFLVLVLAACGSNQNQNQASSQVVAKAPICQSTIPAAPGTTASASTQPGASRHMNMGPHMKMTSYRPVTSSDMARMSAIVQNAHACFDKYMNYRRALQDGYQIFTPNVPQDIYHFASPQNFSEAQTTFDLAHPSALLYQKVGDGYQFVGVMYSAPASATEDQLNQRVPLSIAPWHLHVNFCLPTGDTEQTLFHANSLFGLTGTISTQAQCSKLGGTFYSSMYGWMVHIPLFGSVGIG